MKYLTQYLKKYKKKTALVLLLLLGQVTGTLYIPYLIAGMIDKGILKGDLDNIWYYGIWMLGAALLTTAVSVWGSYVSADLGALFGKELRDQLFDKIEELSVQQFQEIGISSMITRTTSDIANLQQTVGLVLQLAVPAPLIIVTTVVMTAMVSLPMAGLLVGFMAVLVVFILVLLKKSNVLSRGIQMRMDRINRIVREGITGVRVVRAFANEAYEERRSGGAFEDYAANMVRLNKLFAVLNPVIWVVLGLTMAAVVGLGGVFVLGNTMQIGEITAVSEYAIITLSYLILAAVTMTMLPKSRACLMRLQEVFEIVPAVKDTGSQTIVPGGEAVAEFDQVVFAYDGAEEPVICGLSFQCRRGETTAVIGSTGSGKSTVVDLLLRLHDIQSGHIRVEGADIRDISMHTLKEKIGSVPQKAFLFSGTIADNLRMGRADADEKELWEALRIAQADTFVKGLPDGLNAPVSQGGTNFSGGQRQRLSIARALVKRASILIFDDSFSALDVKTDAALFRALQEYVTEPAKLIIAQRVSTIMNADQILVLDEGKLAGVGTHQELLVSCQVYRDIAESQMNQKEA